VGELRLLNYWVECWSSN